jgi:hypothetical protein
MQIEVVRALAGVGKVAVVQNKHVEMLVDKRLSELVYEQVPLLRQIQVVKPNWHRRYNIDTGGLHHDDYVVQRLVPVQYDVHDVNAWYVTWFPSVL